MPQILLPNTDPRYYSQLNAYSGTVGAAGITTFPTSPTVLGAQASASLVFTGNLANGNTITVGSTAITITSTANAGFSLKTLQGNTPIQPYPGANGIVFPFQAMAQYGTQVQLGATQYETMLNLLAFLRSFPDENFQSCYYRLRGNAIVINYNLTGTLGNTFALACSASSNVSITGAATSGAASQSTGLTSGFLYGGTALTNGYATIVEPQQTIVELQYAFVVPKGASFAASTVTMFLCDGTNLRKTDPLSCPGQSALSTISEYSAIPFPLISATTTRVVPQYTGLYAYSSIAQLSDIYAGPGGPY